MSGAKYPGSVIKHGLRYRFNFLAGQPITEWDEDADGMAIVGYYAAEPMWDEADLTTEQLADLEAEAQRGFAEFPSETIDWHRWAVMEWHGVAHTHRRGKPIDERRPALGYACSWCRGFVVAKDPGDYPFVGGPADGKWFVTGGAIRWRVPVMEPASAPSWLTDSRDAFTGPSATVAEYELRGRRYVFVG